MKKRPERRRYELAVRFERAVRQLPGKQQRWLLDRLRAPQTGELDRDFWILDMDSGQWRRL
ncbi:MAG: hypothetical protein EHM56_03260 [Chloroflexi bacterium]|nr:MAG: hypothetical protein EHM56_03260 [Chloroflexota bacterium]